jgi:hypothetical protein
MATYQYDGKEVNEHMRVDMLKLYPELAHVKELVEFVKQIADTGCGCSSLALQENICECPSCAAKELLKKQGRL